MEGGHKLLNDQVDETILRYKDRLLSISKMRRHNYNDVCLGATGLISSGLKRSASMTSQLCMVSLTGGFKDNDSTLTDSHLKETAEQDSPSKGTVIFRDRYGVQMIMRFNEIHKFVMDYAIRLVIALTSSQGNSDQQ
ncbi:hypothetical protein Tco_0470938 [Tanacetum coccineum]